MSKFLLLSYLHYKAIQPVKTLKFWHNFCVRLIKFDAKVSQIPTLFQSTAENHFNLQLQMRKD
ncbi:hypothetical protein A0O21_04980 [Streptococcus pantholopis]|uniref:Uncharacterized protein n=1 Tax=Streptococcus pantholopis TaxID=1811193 RepID=A0A172Q7J0_9STRE|nr:hypothetical protein A0O21_04980 [Streptococcus pantholopis]